jgi:hypothetical protein
VHVDTWGGRPPFRYTIWWWGPDGREEPERCFNHTGVMARSRTYDLHWHRGAGRVTCEVYDATGAVVMDGAYG